MTGIKKHVLLAAGMLDAFAAGLFIGNAFPEAAMPLLIVPVILHLCLLPQATGRGPHAR